MPEESAGGGKKILGMPRKVAIPVLAVGAFVVIYFLIARNRGGAVPRMAPQEGGGFPGGGGGGGGGMVPPTLGGIITSTPVNPWEEANERLAFEREQFEYNVRQRQEDERQKDFEIAFEERRSTLDRFLELLPFQLETEKQKEAAEAAGYEAEAARGRFAEAAFETERIAQVRLGEEASSAPIKCPPGMHPVNMPGVGLTCRGLGDPGGGRGFQPFRQIGNVLGNFLTGVTNAAQGIGYGAAQYGAAQAGILGPVQVARGQRAGTAPFMPTEGKRTGEALPFEGSYTGEQYF